MITSSEKRISLVSSLGAGILGAGVALLFANALQPFAVPALLVGMVVHGGAMVAMMRTERMPAEMKPRWVVATEWTCWLLMLALLAYVAWNLAR